jgi:DNA-binding IclR family transcriptional regulator
MIPEETLLQFAATSISSVWALELLLLMKKTPRIWSVVELVAQLRGSDAAISEALQRLQSAGLVTDEEGGFRYAPSSPDSEALANELDALYRLKPVSVVSAIAKAPNIKLQILSDAFKLKRD